MNTFTLSDDQRAAVEAVKQWFNSKHSERPRVFRLGGLAGTGKTSLVKEIVSSVLEASHGHSVLYTAPTNKAVARLREKGCRPACTLHAAMYYPPQDAKVAKLKAQIKEALDCGRVNKIAKLKKELVAAELEAERSTSKKSLAWTKRTQLEAWTEDGYEKPSLVVVDEASMVSTKIADDLLSFGVPVLAVGDYGQLPPVAGKPFFKEEDLDAVLTTIHRQEDGSAVLDLAAQARNVGTLACRQYGESFVSTIAPITDATYRLFDQIITHSNADRVKINRHVRRLEGYCGTLVVGEKLVGVKNTREHPVRNGVMYRVLKIIDDEAVLRPEPALADDESFRVPLIKPNDRCDDEKETVGLPFGCDYGYAITVHKSQGSEWEHVLVVGTTNPKLRNSTDMPKWYYTAVTRASKSVFVALSGWKPKANNGLTRFHKWYDDVTEAEAA